MKRQAYALLSMLVLYAAPAFGQGWNVNLVSTSYGNWGEVDMVAAHGNYAYVSIIGGDIAVVDVSDPADPIEVALWHHPTGLLTNNLCREFLGNYLYVASGFEGWYILDVSNPLDPVLAARFSSPECPHFCFVGNMAYIGSPQFLYTYDNTDPLNPVLLGQCRLDDYAADVKVSGDYAYVSYVNAYGGVRVIDVSDPYHPVGTAFVGLPGNTGELAVSGNYVFVTCCWFGMYVIDVSDPVHPMVAANFCPSTTWYNKLQMSDNVVFLATSGNEIYAVDVSQPTNPQLLCFFETTPTYQNLFGMDLEGSRLYGAYYYYGIKIIDVSNPQNLQLISSYEPNWTFRDVAYQNGFAFLAADNEGLVVQDVSSPADPVHVSCLDDIGDCQDIVLMGDYAYLQTDSDTTKIVDISDPVHPSLAGSFPLQGRILKIVDDLAYAGAYQDLQILDVSSPLAPVQIGFYDLPSGSIGVLDTDGRFLYAIASFGADYSSIDSLLVLDVNDPTNPQFLGLYNLGGDFNYNHVLVQGDEYLYVAGSDIGLKLYDIADPTQLVQVGQLTMTIAPSDLVVVGNFVYMANEGYPFTGLRIIDVSDPTRPVLVGYYMESVGYYLHLAVHDDYVYANKGSQFVVYDCSDAVHNEVEVTLTPLVSPIQIPASGGGFDYYFFAQNNGPGNQTLGLWTKVILPGGSVLSPIMGPVSVSLDSGTTGWIRHQNVPGRAVAGLYTYIACAGDYPSTIWASDSLQFIKLGSGDWELEAGDWSNTGESLESANDEFIIHNSSFMISARPNPFNPTTVLSFELQAASFAKLGVYEISGRLVTTLVDGWREAGRHEVRFDGTGLPSGVYLYRLQAGDFTTSGKMLLLK